MRSLLVKDSSKQLHFRFASPRHGAARPEFSFVIHERSSGAWNVFSDRRIQQTSCFSRSFVFTRVCRARATQSRQLINSSSFLRVQLWCQKGNISFRRLRHSARILWRFSISCGNRQASANLPAARRMGRVSDAAASCRPRSLRNRRWRHNARVSISAVSKPSLFGEPNDTSVQVAETCAFRKPHRHRSCSDISFTFIY